MNFIRLHIDLACGLLPNIFTGIDPFTCSSVSMDLLANTIQQPTEPITDQTLQEVLVWSKRRILKGDTVRIKTYGFYCKHLLHLCEAGFSILVCRKSKYLYGPDETDEMRCALSTTPVGLALEAEA